MSVATIKDGQLVLPAELLQQIGLKEGDPVAVEAVDAYTLMLRAATPDDADAQLLELLDVPFDLGVVGPLDRAALYTAAGSVKGACYRAASSASRSASA